MRRLGFTTLAALVLILATAAGCGSSASSDEGQVPAPTKAEFIKTADAICEAADKAQRAAQRIYEEKPSGSGSGSKSQEQLILVVGLPPIRTQAQELSELMAPSGDEQQIGAIVEGLEEAVEKAEEDPSSMLGKRSPGPFADVFRMAKAYGFKACSTPI